MGIEFSIDAISPISLTSPRRGCLVDEGLDFLFWQNPVYYFYFLRDIVNQWPCGVSWFQNLACIPFDGDLWFTWSCFINGL